ncbi:beta-lactamase family protein [Sandaracinobacteroides saxicola]|uniref:Beta-lactamase family protein n=1 Tax=Sandaracinobacteroides saxicola TaxID=2759707 RepID=A0A7G5IN09_9SPHN|nr:beta-lactamase family protein [Sandaracinobacteroides saxicola]
MPKSRFASTIAVLLFLATPATAQPASPAAPPAAPAAASIVENADVAAAQRLFTAWIEAQIAMRGLPGIAVGVVHDQQLVWSRGFGFADVEKRVPMTPQTRFRIASNSKMFAAIAIMQLREAGRLRLDDPVAKHLPWFKVTPAGPDDGPITIEQLLSHSAGLPREASDHWSSFDFPTGAQLQALMADRAATFPPQTRWKYSNLAYGVAGLLVERISGQRWADYVQAHIFDPLGMAGTSVDRRDPLLATPYASRRPDGSRRLLPFVDSKGMASATGVTSDVEDLAKFISAQFRRGAGEGANILSAGSWREMLRVRSVDEDWQSGTGLGFAHSRYKDRTYVGHGGGYPGNTTMTLAQLDDKVGVIVLTNTNDSNAGDIARQLMATVGNAVANAGKPATNTPWDPAWARFAGRYRGSSDGIDQVVLLNRQLVLLPGTALAAETKVVLEPLGEGRFRLTAPTGGAAIGEIVRFDETPGRPMRLYRGDSWATRTDDF